MTEGRRATGAHVLQHQAPAIGQTTEQKIRVAVDRVGDWIFVVCGYDADALQRLILKRIWSPIVSSGAEPRRSRTAASTRCPPRRRPSTSCDAATRRVADGFAERRHQRRIDVEHRPQGRIL